MGDRAEKDSWRLQSLTPLESLPDYDENTSYGVGAQDPGAPVEPDGTPVYYHVPRSFEQARNDGERWRYALAQAAEVNPDSSTRPVWRLPISCSISSEPRQSPCTNSSPRPATEGARAPGILALDTLKDNETIARLATGIKRFTLPDEFNPIKIYESVANRGRSSHGEQALDKLAGLFENRRQFDRAALYLPAQQGNLRGRRRDWKTHKLSQILGNWGQFEASMTQPAGKGATASVPFPQRPPRSI